MDPSKHPVNQLTWWHRLFDFLVHGLTNQSRIDLYEAGKRKYKNKQRS